MIKTKYIEGKNFTWVINNKLGKLTMQFYFGQNNFPIIIFIVKLWLDVSYASA